MQIAHIWVLKSVKVNDRFLIAYSKITYCFQLMQGAISLAVSLHKMTLHCQNACYNYRNLKSIVLNGGYYSVTAVWIHPYASLP